MVVPSETLLNVGVSSVIRLKWINDGCAIRSSPKVKDGCAIRSLP